jgi:membrane protease YdiL (CAAX protease family)
MAELALAPRLVVGPLSGAALFLVLTGGRLPRAWPRLPRRAAIVRWASLAVAAGLEELAWRWLVLGGLAVAVGPLSALALSTLGFAVSHRPSLGRRCWVHLFTGAGFGAAFLAGGIAAAVLAHGVYNILVDWAVHAERARVRGP